MSKHKRTIKNYQEAVSFLEALSNISNIDRKSKKAAEERLENFTRFLKFLGNPEKSPKIIHIAGTSGKGSVATMLQNILISAEKKTGVYTSPHTTTFCERIKVGDKYISEKDLADLTNFLKNKMDEYIYKLQTINYKLTLNFFEASFCLALLYFQKQKCEYAVIETGMGGRYDATNAVKKPVYTIITNIGRDHLETIGPALKDVAYEKAGIIKKGSPCLTGEKNQRWIKIFNAECRMQNAECRITNYKNLKNIKTDLDGTEFEYKNEKYSLKLLGEHQASNAILAIECANDLKIGKQAIKKGLANTIYPARLEVISKKPFIIIDGAHNEDKLKAAAEFLRQNTHYATRYLIIAMARNKKVKILPEFFRFFDKIYFTRFSNPFRKCFSLGDWQRILPKSEKKKMQYRHLAKDALLDILLKLGNNDLLLVTGSIFLAGEVREYWHPANKIIKNRKSV